ncbi:hypothetical protein ACFE04_016111 [Oxalis oulophora]
MSSIIIYPFAKRLTLSINNCFSIKSFSNSALQHPKVNNFIVFFNSEISKHGRNRNLKEAESVFNRMPYKNVVSWTAMLTAYAQNGEISKARGVFDTMPHRTTASYNAMLTAYIRNNLVEEAFQMFEKTWEKNPVSYAAMITGFVQAGILDRAEELYGKVSAGWRDPVCSNSLMNGYLKLGRLEEAVTLFEGMIERDVVSWSSMLDGYCKKGRIFEARELFHKMPERNVVTWTSMIDGYMKGGFFNEGFGLFLSMRGDCLVTVNSTTFTIILEACGDFGRQPEGLQVHGLVLRMGFEFDGFLGSSMISMYCKFGCLDVARLVFQIMSKKDVISWNLLITGHIQNDDIDEAYIIFERMKSKDEFSWTTMITGFANIGNMEKAVELFGMMPKKDGIAWTSVISGFVTNDEHEQAFHWFNSMIANAIQPNPITFSSLISASAGLATLDQGLQIHAHVIKMIMENDLSIQNSLISMYTKCGNVVDAYNIFNDITSPNIVSYNSMITGFAQNGFREGALKLFTKMMTIGQEPNEITFLAVLSTCVHVGLVEEGKKYFEKMKSVYHIEPSVDHYACMVDLLGRAGLFDEIIDLVNSMPMKPHAGVWGALLSASREHLCVDLAKLAAEQLIDLEPGSATPYVVLSNLYSISGKKKDEDQIRKIKKLKGIKKSPGCSWITVQNRVHLFLAGDDSHKEIELVKVTLQTIMKEMREMYDFDKNGTMSFEEFVALNKFLTKVQQAFSDLERDRGYLLPDAVFEGLQKIGFSLDSPAFYTVCESFDKQKNGVFRLDDFISLCIFVQSSRNLFNSFDTAKQGRVTLDFNQFVYCSKSISDTS